MNEAVNRFASHPIGHITAFLARGLLAPRCLICDEPGTAEQDLCPACAHTLPWSVAACRGCALPLPPALKHQALCGTCQRHHSALHQCWAAFIYASPVDELLLRFKFHHDLAAGQLLSQLMQRALRRHVNDQALPQALIPIPLHRARLRQRGYDQALELAKPLARELGLPLRQGLHRQRATQPQSELDAAARRRNLRGAFTAHPPLPKHVVLIDDVMTTGATLQAAAQALHHVGVERVDAWVCARVLVPTSKPNK